MDYQRLFNLTEDILILRGGRGSGNWGHVGRKGKKGGSGRGGGHKFIGVKGKTSRTELKAKKKEAKKKLGENVDMMWTSIPPGAKKDKNSFYKVLSGMTGEHGTIAVIDFPTAQALANKFEKELIVTEAADTKRKKAHLKKISGIKKTRLGDVKNAKPISDAEASEAYKDFHKKTRAPESNALNFYQDAGYKPVNNHLRFGDEASNLVKEDIDNLDRAMVRSATPRDMTVFRGTDSKVYLDALGKNPSEWIGRTFSDAGFVSTSIDENKAFEFRGVITEIRVPKGAKGIYLGNLPSGRFNKEKEIMLDRNTGFRIVGVDTTPNKSGQTITRVIAEVIEQA